MGVEYLAVDKTVFKPISACTITWLEEFIFLQAYDFMKWSQNAIFFYI